MSLSKDLKNYPTSCGIPPKCFTCGRNISHLYGLYMDLVETKNKTSDKNKLTNKDIIKKLGLDDRYCCATHLISHPKNLTNKL